MLRECAWIESGVKSRENRPKKFLPPPPVPTRIRSIYKSTRYIFPPTLSIRYQAINVKVASSTPICVIASPCSVNSLLYAKPTAILTMPPFGGASHSVVTCVHTLVAGDISVCTVYTPSIVKIAYAPRLKLFVHAENRYRLPPQTAKALDRACPPRPGKPLSDAEKTDRRYRLPVRGEGDVAYDREVPSPVWISNSQSSFSKLGSDTGIAGQAGLDVGVGGTVGVAVTVIVIGD